MQGSSTVKSLSPLNRPKSMIITLLMTNNTLDCYGGSECYLRDVARYMLGRGHRVICYSKQLGPVAEEIRKFGGIVVQDLHRLGINPDIIHGHHHIDTTCAMMMFPGVPVVHFTHGALPWEEGPPPPSPRIMKYVCISKITADALLSKQLESKDKIIIIPNFVCSEIFQRRRSMQASKESESLRVLIFGNYRPRDRDRIHAVCNQAGACLDEIGAWTETGNKPDPWNFLPDYDVVFAYGRSAMEALSCGCDVILCHETGTGELVTDLNFEKYYDRNFGFTTVLGSKGESYIKSMLSNANESRLRGESCLAEGYRMSLDSSRHLERIEEVYKEAIMDWEITGNKQAIFEEEQGLYATYLARLQRERFDKGAQDKLIAIERDETQALKSLLARARAKVKSLRR